jgi:hypothetical protein
MKYIIHIRFFFIIFFAFVCAQLGYAQDSAKIKKAAIIQNKIENRKFTFVADFALPMRGITRQLTTPYDLEVSHDSLISYLPYFGQSYTAPLDPTKISFDFTSTNFDYKVSNRKKGKWEVSIRPKDQNNVQQIELTVFDNGSASLNVTSIDREPISYNGHIEGEN